MNLNTVTSYLIWGILVAESVLGLALLISGLVFRSRQKQSVRSAARKAEYYASMLASAATAEDPAKGAACLKGVQRAASAASDCLSNLVALMLAHRVTVSEVQALIDAEIGKADRGAIRLCGFLARTAPLAGLAGTLVGVQASLSAFSVNRTDPGLIIAGFATAVQTTLAGIVVAFMCLGASRLLIEPRLKRTAMEMFDMSMRLVPKVQAAKAKVLQIVGDDKVEQLPEPGPSTGIHPGRASASAPGDHLQQDQGTGPAKPRTSEPRTRAGSPSGSPPRSPAPPKEGPHLPAVVAEASDRQEAALAAQRSRQEAGCTGTGPAKAVGQHGREMEVSDHVCI
jgi:biopolymer transport protein ExbB/TolQ